jgi:8-oxo-dGTP diphosphatase
MREAAGYILFWGRSPDRRFLLLRSARHGTWAFPKGHLEPGEDVRSGARRELYEETGIQVIYEIRDFEGVIEYGVPAKHHPDFDEAYDKRVRFLLAEAPSREITRSEEHDAGEWLSAEETLERISHEELRRVFQQALQRIAEGGR